MIKNKRKIVRNKRVTQATQHPKRKDKARVCACVTRVVYVTLDENPASDCMTQQQQHGDKCSNRAADYVCVWITDELFEYYSLIRHDQLAPIMT